MREWLGGGRGRLLAATAVLVGIIGALFYPEDAARFDGAAQAPGQAGAPSALASQSLTVLGGAEPSPAAADGQPLPPEPDQPPAAGEDLKDAVADFSASAWTKQAARSAAFAAPGGRLPGAFAPAAAPSAKAALQALATRAQGPSPRPPTRIFGRPESRGRITPAGPTSSGAPDPTGRERGSPGPAEKGLPSAAQQPAATAAERFFSASGMSPAAAVGSQPGQILQTTPGQRQRAWPRRRLRPALLSRLLGRRPLRAPLGVTLPVHNPWGRAIPTTSPDGATLVNQPLGMAAAQSIGEPPRCGRKAAHWESVAALGRWRHEAGAYGFSSAAGWAWLSRERARLWLWPDPASAPLLRYEGHWWMKSRGLWFLVHDGAPWGAQYLPEWGREGFVHPSGAQIIYSEDGSRVGLIEPGQGAILYDAATGEPLGRWSSDQLPRRTQPTAPAQLPPVR